MIFITALLTLDGFHVQGSASAAGMSGTDGLLPPAKEHVYDALAAFDAGQLQEAQHAFDLSVWADVKNDRGTLKHQASLTPVVDMSVVVACHCGKAERICKLLCCKGLQHLQSPFCTASALLSVG